MGSLGRFPWGADRDTRWVFMFPDGPNRVTRLEPTTAPAVAEARRLLS